MSRRTELNHLRAVFSETFRAVGEFPLCRGLTDYGKYRLDSTEAGIPEETYDKRERVDLVAKVLVDMLVYARYNNLTKALGPAVVRELVDRTKKGST